MSTEPKKQVSIQYDSNPFTTAWTGIQKLIRKNAQTVVGTAFFNILLAIILALTFIVCFFALFTFVINHDEALRNMYPLPANTALGFLTSMSDTSIYATWIIGGIVLVFVIALMQSLQLQLAIASAKNTAIKFGELLKRSLKTTLPLIGLAVLILLAFVLTVIIIALLSLALGYVTVILALVALLAFVYVELRLSFAAFSIVDEHLGPVEAMRRSWKITQDHVMETIGSGAVGLLIIAIPGLIFDALARVTEGVPVLSGVFGLLNGLVAIVLVVAATVSLAERYTQLQAVKDKKLTTAPLSPFNYLAVTVFLIVAPIVGALSPQLGKDQNNPFNGVHGPTAPNSRQLPTTLN